MSLRQECLWEHLTPERPQAPSLLGEHEADVCVVGAGFTGLSAALHLLEAGRSVCVLEAHRTGHGGAGRNVGLVNAGLWIPPDEIEAGMGQEVGSRLNRMLGAAPSLVFSLIDKYAIDCQARREGTLHMAHNQRGLDDLRSRCEQWQRRGAPVELLTGAAAPRPAAPSGSPALCSTAAPAPSTPWPTSAAWPAPWSAWAAGCTTTRR